MGYDPAVSPQTERWIEHTPRPAASEAGSEAPDGHWTADRITVRTEGATRDRVWTTLAHGLLGISVLVGAACLALVLSGMWALASFVLFFAGLAAVAWAGLARSRGTLEIRIDPRTVEVRFLTTPRGRWSATRSGLGGLTLERHRPMGDRETMASVNLIRQPAAGLRHRCNLGLGLDHGSCAAIFDAVAPVLERHGYDCIIRDRTRGEGTRESGA